MPKYLVIVSTVSTWLEKASKEQGVFHFPPNRKPRILKLSEGDICIVYLYDRKVFAGEFEVVEVKEITGKEFYRKYANKAVEVAKAPFPKPNDKVRIIIYKGMKTYPQPIAVGDVKNIESIGPLGYTRVLKWEKYSWIYEQIKATLQAQQEIHENLKKCLMEIGEVLGFYAKKEEWSPDKLYRFDVVWYGYRGAPRPLKVFEIENRSNIDLALARLNHAYDVWGSELYLVITEEKDFERARKLINPYLKGAFHRLRDKIEILLPNQISEITKTIQKHKQILKKLTRK